MIGIGGKFSGGAKGMVAVPDLSNLTPAQAESALSAAGLTRGAVNTENTSNSGLGNKVYYQSLTAGELADYESVVAFNYRVYVAPAAPTPVLCGGWYLYTVSTGYECATNGTNLSLYYEITENRQNYCLSGIETGDYIVDANSRQKIYPQGANAWQARDGKCGYVTPPPTPTAPACDPEKNWTKTTSYTAACSGGEKVTTTRYINSCPGVADKLVKTSVICCTVATVCGAWSAYIGGGSSRTCTTTNADCTTKSVVENRCLVSYTSWVNSGSCVGGRRTQTRTKTNADCTTTKETQTVTCGTTSAV